MARQLLVIADLRGGRNGTDPPLSLPQDQCVEALNVDWYDGLLARKRNGSDSVTTTGGTAFSNGLQTLIRHIPGADETAAELWGIDGAATPLVKRLTGGTSFADVTLADAIATNPQHVVGASLNGKLFLAYDTTVDRLHAYDPSLASAQVRRVGLAASSAPTVANGGGAGTYPATLRYYKQDTIQLDGTRVVRRSELSASVSFTPSGSDTNATVTRGAFPSEGETHWRVWGSADNGTYYNISGNIVVATTTYADTATPSGYSANTAQDLSGTYTVPKSVRYLLADGNRLLMAGAWESGGKNSRVFFTPVLGSSDQGDDERVTETTLVKNWLDLNENDGGFITALGGPLDGSPYAFKYRQIWKLVPTGDVTTPYLPRRRTDSIGCIAHKTVVMAEDEAGRPALYFLSHKGPYRLGSAGLQYLGRDNEDIWSTVNLGASTIVAHTVYYPDIHQIWWWIATGSSNDPDTRMVFDTLLGEVDDKNRVRKGWSRHNGNAAGARCSTMFSNTLGASMSRALKPYFGRSSGTTLLKGDTSATDDAGTNFQAYVKIRPIVSTIGRNLGVGLMSLLAKVASGVTITATIDRDWGLETRAGTVLLTASAAGETRVLRKIEDTEMSGAGVIQVQLGDGSAASNGWTLDALAIPVDAQEPR